MAARTWQERSPQGESGHPCYASPKEGSKFLQPFGFTRRDLLLKSAALGAVVVAPSLSLAEAIDGWQRQQGAPLKPTAWDEIGPFYKRDAPHVTHLRKRGDPGLPVDIAGNVFDTRGDILSGATIEIWQANHAGLYDLAGNAYRTTLVTDAKGGFPKTTTSNWSRLQSISRKMASS
jgi:hypothetical protein